MNTLINVHSLKTILMIVLMLGMFQSGVCKNPWSTTLSAPVVWHPLQVQEGLAAILITDLVPGQEYRLELSGEGQDCMEWFSLKNGSQIVREPANGIIFIAEGTAVKLMWDQICLAQLTMNLLPVEQKHHDPIYTEVDVAEQTIVVISGLEDLVRINAMGLSDSFPDEQNDTGEPVDTRNSDDSRLLCQFATTLGKKPN